MDINLRKNKAVIIGDLIDEFMNRHKDKFSGVPTVTELRSKKQQMKDSDYRIPKHEISIWKENGWKYSDCGNYLIRKKQQVEIQKIY